jgi:hypothetical protein
LCASRRVLKAGGVAKERINAVGRVEAAGGVADKGIDTGSRILGAAGIVEQGAEFLIAFMLSCFGLSAKIGEI